VRLGAEFGCLRLAGIAGAKKEAAMRDQKVREIMTPNPVCLPASATVVEAAEQMRANNKGDPR
jgi:CBS domain-containing protein